MHDWNIQEQDYSQWNTKYVIRILWPILLKGNHLQSLSRGTTRESLVYQAKDLLKTEGI